MYAVQQFPGQQLRPQQYQYGTVGGYYPTQTNRYDQHVFGHDADDHDGHDDGYPDAHDEGRHRLQQGLAGGEIYKEVRR